MALPTASDNKFPKVILTESAAPASPSAGDQKVYIDSTSHHLSRKDSSGTVVDLETNQVAASLSTPTIVAVGTAANGTGDITPGLPTGHTTNDILVIEVQSGNQDVSAPAGYAKMGPAVGFGSAGAAGATRLTRFWKRDGGSEVGPTVTDPGDHAFAVMYAVRGCPTTGDPFLSIGQTRKTTASTTGTARAGATPVDACLVVTTFADALDSSSARYSSPTNADLGSVTEQFDGGTTDGNGGGLCVITGTKAKAGEFTTTTVTETSTVDVSSTVIFLPSGIVSRAGFIDTQHFTTPGLADTWTRPTGGKRLSMTLIGGGGGGGAGRNAATAAGGGGGGAGMVTTLDYAAQDASLTVTAGAGGAATANTDGATGNDGGSSTVADASRTFLSASNGTGGAGATTGSGGAGGSGGTSGAPAAAGTTTYTMQGAGGGAGGTTAANGGDGFGVPASGGAAGAGGGTSQATSRGGRGTRSPGAGGGGRSNTNVGTGGAAIAVQLAGGASAGANGADSPSPLFGGSGAAGGTSAAGPGGTGGWPGGGGGGGGSQSGAQRGGAGADGVVTIVTLC